MRIFQYLLAAALLAAVAARGAPLPTSPGAGAREVRVNAPAPRDPAAR
jgi:hypothetical protein